MSLVQKKLKVFLEVLSAREDNGVVDVRTISNPLDLALNVDALDILEIYYDGHSVKFKDYMKQSDNYYNRDIMGIKFKLGRTFSDGTFDIGSGIIKTDYLNKIKFQLRKQSKVLVTELRMMNEAKIIIQAFVLKFDKMVAEMEKQSLLN